MCFSLICSNCATLGLLDPTWTPQCQYLKASGTQGLVYQPWLVPDCQHWWPHPRWSRFRSLGDWTRLPWRLWWGRDIILILTILIRGMEVRQFWYVNLYPGNHLVSFPSQCQTHMWQQFGTNGIAFPPNLSWIPSDYFTRLLSPSLPLDLNHQDVINPPLK